MNLFIQFFSNSNFIFRIINITKIFELYFIKYEIFYTK